MLGSSGTSFERYNSNARSTYVDGPKVRRLSVLANGP